MKKENVGLLSVDNTHKEIDHCLDTLNENVDSVLKVVQVLNKCHLD